jgi:hypothetical protein
MATTKFNLLVSTIALCARLEGEDAPWKLVWSGEFEGASESEVFARDHGHAAAASSVKR